MKQILAEMTVNDDHWFDLGMDKDQMLKAIVGEELYYHGRVALDMEFIDRDWNNYTSTIQISITGNYRDILWFRLKFTPKI